MTDKQQGGVAIENSENIYKAIFENSIDAILITKTDGSIIEANPAACKLFNRTEKEIVDAGRRGIIDINDERLTHLLNERAANGKSRGELRMIRGPLNYFPTEVSSSEFIDRNGEEFTVMVIRDISDRKFTESELSNEKQSIQTLFDTMTEGVALNEMVLDSNGEMIDYRILKVNKAFYSTADFTGQIVEGNVASKLYGMKKEVINDFWRVHSKKNETAYTEMISPLNQKSFYIATSPFRNNQFITTFIDITEIKRSEQKLKENEEKYRLLAEFSGIGVGLYSPEGEILYFNNRALQNLGAKEEDFIEKNVVDVFGPVAGKTYLERFRKACESEGFSEYEDFFESPNGRFWFLSNYKRVCNSEGKVIGIQVLAHDITERKKTEETLKIKEANLRSIIENSTGSIWSIDDNFCLIDSNMTFREDFRSGTGLDVSAGDNILNPLPDSIKENWKEYYIRGLSGESFSIIEKLLPPFEPKSIRYNFNPMRTVNGKIIGLSIIGQDITDLVKSEDNLKQTTENLRNLTHHMVEVREAERTMIARDLHDDLGQKLTALIMDMSWVKSRIGVQSTPVLNKIKQMQVAMNEIIESIQKLSFGISPGILNDLGLVPAIQWLIKEYNAVSYIKVHLSFTPKTISLNSKLSLAVYRIIQEALTNIARHSGASAASIDLNLTDNKLEVIISDNGSGIGKKEAESSKSFGLIGMHERVMIFNGKISITGSKGKGTQVRVEIPVNG